MLLHVTVSCPLQSLQRIMKPNSWLIYTEPTRFTRILNSWIQNLISRNITNQHPSARVSDTELCRHLSYLQTTPRHRRSLSSLHLPLACTIPIPYSNLKPKSRIRRCIYLFRVVQNFPVARIPRLRIGRGRSSGASTRTESSIRRDSASPATIRRDALLRPKNKLIIKML